MDWKTSANTLLTVHVKTRAKKQSLQWIDDSTVKIWVVAAPEKGRANKEVLEMLAGELSLRVSQLEIVRGHTTAMKQVKIS